MADYPKPSLTSDALVLADQGPEMQILLIKRKKEPHQGKFALPGGFADPYELPRETCLRECMEETGLQLNQHRAITLSLRCQKGRDPRGWTISQPFLFHLDQPQPIKAGDDAAEVHWVPLKDLEKLAFDHGAILCEALAKFWSWMPTGDPKLHYLQGYGCPEEPKQVLFYGGTFDPWHQGHQHCVSVWQGPQLKVLVPDFNPLKNSAIQGCAFQKFRLLTEEVQKSDYTVFPGFLGLEYPNPTSSWVPLVKPNTTFLMGDDSFLTLKKWVEAPKLIKHLEGIAVVPRDYEKASYKPIRDWALSINPNLQLSFFDQHPYQHLSSSEIRAKQ